MVICTEKVQSEMDMDAVDHKTNTILAYVFGRRKDEVFKS